MATYTDENATITAVGVYSDAACTTLVEALSVSNVGTGLYEATAELNYGLYTLGQVYYLKVTYTPSGDTSRSQVFPFLVAPQGLVSTSSTTTTTAADGTRLQPPLLQLRVGCGTFRESEYENFVEATRNRFEAEFPMPANRRGKVLFLSVENFCAHEPWAPVGMAIEAAPEGNFRTGQEST